MATVIEMAKAHVENLRLRLKQLDEQSAMIANERVRLAELIEEGAREIAKSESELIKS